MTEDYKIEILHLEPNDLLVVKVDAVLTQAKASEIRDIIGAKANLSKDSILVIDNGTELSVLRPAPAPDA